VNYLQLVLVKLVVKQIMEKMLYK